MTYFYLKNSTNQMQLQTDCILNVPVQSYDEFTFIVNGEKFKTTRLVSDLLSKKVSQIHQNEPTLCEYTINTRSKGDFSLIIKLASFQLISIPDKEFPFIREIIEILDNDSIMIGDEESQQEITLDNVFDLITRHQQFKQTYSKSLTQEIDFLSSHFYELDESKREQLKGLPLWMIERVINNPKLRLFEEDQLLTFI